MIAAFYETSEDEVNLEFLTSRLWRSLIYPQIDYIRKQLIKLEGEEEKRSLNYQLDTVILNQLGRLGNLNSCFTSGKRELFERGAFLFDEYDSRQRKSLVKLLTYSGDLVRYRTSYNKCFGSFDQFQSAKEFYLMGHRVDPDDGSIFNQLAVIESLSPTKSVPQMIYFYCRALGSEIPSEIAKENLLRLLNKFGSLFQYFLDILGEKTFGPSVDLLKMLENYPGEEHLLYASIQALGQYLRITAPKLFMRKMNREMKLLLNGLSDISEFDDSIDLEFASSLIGSSFVEKSTQEIILRFVNHLPPSQHEQIQLPLSLTQ